MSPPRWKEAKNGWKLALNSVSAHFPRVKAILILSLLVMMVLGLYGNALNSWWCCDDTQILKHAIQYSPSEYFFVPKAWRALIISSLTPWLSLAYDIDHTFFGFNPTGFYAHNLLVIALCAFLIYLTARQWVDEWHAIGGAMLFLVGSPVALASQELMVRHYVEGLLYYLLALLLFTRGMPSKSYRVHWLAGVAFAIAASAKEIYLPLGLVPLLLPLGSFRQRLRKAWPFLLVMLLYVFWRWHMLGEVVGGYTPSGELASIDLGSLLAQFANIPGFLFAVPSIGLAGIGLAAILVVANGTDRWRSLLLMSVTLGLLLAPLVPLVRFPGLVPGSDRYYFALWAGISLGTTVALGHLVRDLAAGVRALSLLIIAVLCVTGWSKSRQLLVGLSPTMIEQHAQGRALASAGQQDILYLTPTVPDWYVAGVIDLREAMGTTRALPLLVTDEVNLARLGLSGRRVLRYDSTTGVMADVTARVPEVIAQWRASLRQAVLSIEIEYDRKQPSVRWRLGPYQTGSYTYLRETSRIPVPPQGSLRGPPPLVCFRFRFDAPEGWVAYTPLLSLPPEDSRGISRLSWHGQSESYDAVVAAGCPIEAKQ